jgi:hypothetical protein
MTKLSVLNNLLVVRLVGVWQDRVINANWLQQTL